MLSNGTGAENSGTLVQFPHLIDGQRRNKEPAQIATIGPKNRGQNEDQGQQPQVDVVVPGSRFGYAALFRAGTAGGICFVRFGIRSDRLRLGCPLSASPGLGSRCGGSGK